MKAFAVVGSCWGDECKGMAVDAIASRYPEAIVIRSGGGAQCGHTVELSDGRRHIFSHFGSGTFAGCPTYLSKRFVVNVRCFRNELEELRTIGVEPKVCVHPEALMTTPFDVWVNRQIERKRGDAKHGSVGIGHGETVERSERGGPVFTVSKFIGSSDDWVARRCSELGLEPYNYKDYQEEWCQFDEDQEYFLDNVTYAEPKHILADVYIFEGAQGLLLDKDRGIAFPHLTRSNTGLQNVIPLCQAFGIDKLKVVYMSRPYLTRHGAGPLCGEGDWESAKDKFNIVDETNKHGEWQGTLRFAPMNKVLVKNAIWQDLKQAVGPVAISYYNGYSCLDQQIGSTHVADLGGKPALYGFGPRRDQYEVEQAFIS